MNLAVTEVSESTFQIYVIALAVSGLLMLLAAIVGFGSTGGARALSGIVGLGFLGYAIYLEFFLGEGTFTMFYYAFIAPIVVLVNVFRSRKNREAAPQ
jgi:hypothetical protein